jgi:2,4-dienoyl-CoA reductase (NADPH2)
MTHERFRFKDREDLERRIGELGLDIPLSDDIAVLFTPIQIGDRSLPNRLVVHPMEGADASPSGSPSDLTFRRYRRFAEGGASMIWFEAAAVTGEGRSNPRQLRIGPETTAGLKRLVEETRRTAGNKFGPGHGVFLVLQLTHSGRFSKPGETPRPVITHHSPLLDARLGLPPDYPLITDEELDSLQEAFVSASDVARRAGFDAVDIKACHGYLVSELLASFTRTGSRYGGPLANRVRFLVETAEKIRASVQGIFVTSRLNVFDALPYPYGFGVNRNNPGQFDMTEPIELIEILENSGLPLLSIACGIPAYAPHYGRPFDKPLIGQEPPDEHPLASVARLLRLTGEVQKAFPGVAVLGPGYSWLRQFFPHAAAAAVRTGKAALIGLGRESLAYPDWPNELAEKGVLDPARVCLTCSKCSLLLREGSRVGCPVRDADVYAAEYRETRKVARRQKRAVRRRRSR